MTRKEFFKVIGDTINTIGGTANRTKKLKNKLNSILDKDNPTDIEKLECYDILKELQIYKDISVVNPNEIL